MCSCGSVGGDRYPPGLRSGLLVRPLTLCHTDGGGVKGKDGSDEGGGLGAGPKAAPTSLASLEGAADRRSSRRTPTCHGAGSHVAATAAGAAEASAPSVPTQCGPPAGRG